MDNNEQKSRDAHQKFLTFLVASVGGDITAPEEVLRSEMQSFVELKNEADNDEAVDSMVALSRIDSQQERLEIIKLLSMKFLSVTTVMKLESFLRDYVTHILGYLKDHPEARDPDSEGKGKRAIEDIFGF